jgi:hypothetical protein
VLPRWTTVTVLSMLVTTAHAETRKIDNDLALSVDSSLWVVKGKQRARLVTASAFKSMTVDKANKKVVVDVADNTCVGNTKHEFTFAHLEARLENWAAHGLHQRKDLKGAAAGFDRAVKLDPTWRIPAYNLASAHQLLGDKAAAVAALAPWLKAEPIATYVQVTSDPDLAPLLVRPELAALHAKQAGNAKVTNQGFPTLLDKTRGLIAYARSESSGGGMNYTIDLQIYDAKTGALVASTPLVHWDDTNPENGKLTAAGTKAVPARAERYTKMLANLGFSTTKLEEATIKEHDSQAKMMAHFAKAKLGVVATPDLANALRGNTRVGTVKSEGQMHAATFVEEASAVIVKTQRHAIEAGCEAGPEIGVYVMPIK